MGHLACKRFIIYKRLTAFDVLKPMPRKSTGRTTTHIRVPIEYKEEILEAIEQIKQTKLPPLPLHITKAMVRASLRRDLKLTEEGKQRLVQALEPWKQKAIKRLGKLAARIQVQLVYGDDLADLLFPFPPVSGYWWEVLGVSVDSPASIVKAAYKKIAQEWHPDYNQDCISEATEVMKAVNRAWEEFKIKSRTYYQ